MNSPHPLQSLIEELHRLPGIGEKSATRLAFFLYKAPDAYVKSLSRELLKVKERVRLCSICANLTEMEPCFHCSDSRRSDELLCVVETPQDLFAIDRGREFRGRYHVLHGSLSPLDGIGPDQLKIRELTNRVEKGVIKEVILATNPTIEGEATALYIAKIIHSKDVKITRLSLGIPMGAELEYVDEVTLGRALLNRTEV